LRCSNIIAFSSQSLPKQPAKLRHACAVGQDAAHPDRATQKKEAWWPAVEANWSLGKEGRSDAGAEV